MVEKEREKVFDKRVRVSCSGSRQTLRESKKCEWNCRVAERPGWGLPLIVPSLLTSQIWCTSPSVYLIQTLSKMSLDDADLADLKRELEASGECRRRIPSRSLSIPTRPRPLQPPQRPPPPGEWSFPSWRVGPSWIVCACHVWVTKKVIPCSEMSGCQGTCTCLPACFSLSITAISNGRSLSAGWQILHKKNVFSKDRIAHMFHTSLPLMLASWAATLWQ